MEEYGLKESKLERLFKLKEEIHSIVFFAVFIIALFVGFVMLSFVFFLSWFFFFGILRMVTPFTIEAAIINAYFINIAVWAIITHQTFRRKKK